MFAAGLYLESRLAETVGGGLFVFAGRCFRGPFARYGHGDGRTRSEFGVYSDTAAVLLHHLIGNVQA